MAKKALVISGGGSKGAFAVGVIKYLKENKPELEFDIIAGTSTGALITPLAALGEIDELERLYTSVKTEDILLKGNIANRLLSSSSLYDVSPFVKLVKKEYPPKRYEKLMSSGKEIYLATVCLQTRRTVYFSNKDRPGTDVYDVIKIANREELLRAMMASANEPVFMPPMPIRSSHSKPRQYVDGGVQEYAPIQIAIDAGATKVYAIFHSPAKPETSSTKYKSAADILGRTIKMFLDEIGENDLALPKIYDDALDYIQEVKARIVKDTPLSKEEVDALFKMNSRFDSSQSLDIQVIRPEIELPSSGLDFKPKVMKEMLQTGFNIAEKKFTLADSGENEEATASVSG